jgi:mono/diheme cytochrome c family protein
MKKALKIAGILIASILLIGLIIGLYINTTGIPSYEVNAPDIQVEIDSARLARGEKLVGLVCAGCHRGEGGKLVGKYMSDVPDMFGKVWSPNITNHPDALGKYTDGELIYLLRTGIKRDGKYAPPYMAKLPNMSDEDLQSIVAYLRSDAPMVQADDRIQPAPQPSFLVKMLSHIAFKPLPYPEEEIIAPPISDKVAYGRYLAVGVADCYGCHSADFTTLNMLEPEKSAGYFGGGNALLDEAGNTILSSNLTMHETGLANWTEEEFIQCVKNGIRPDKTMVSSVMPKHTMLDDEEISTIWAYLQTIPKLENAVVSASAE